MAGAKTSGTMSTKLHKVAQRAKREPEARLLALAHLVNREMLGWAFAQVRKDAAVGVDGVTKEVYAAQLEQNLQGLHERLKTGRYRHQPIRRAHLQKDGGKTRPIGISTVEDKVVQTAVAKVLEAVYEQDFLDCSYGFRPGRRAHDALRTLQGAMYRGECNWVLELDVQSYFDSLDRNRLWEMLRQRLADESFLRLIGKCVHVGVLDGAQYSEPDEGTAQGSVLSPMLGNIYLHYVLDHWFETVVKVRLKGKASLVRYADDFVIGFELEQDARRVMEVLPQRMAKYGLSLHPDKTRLLPFRRPPKAGGSGKGETTFDFLGFTLYWARARTGRWGMWCKTRSASLRRGIKSVYDWCRGHRHLPVQVQRKALARRTRGHYNYFGVSGNFRSLQRFAEAVRRVWHKWLCRRSQRSRLTWERYSALFKTRWQLPKPRITVKIWGS